MHKFVNKYFFYNTHYSLEIKIREFSFHMQKKEAPNKHLTMAILEAKAGSKSLQFNLFCFWIRFTF